MLAGRSMGGRMGSVLAAGGEPCVGLLLYAYPLHPIGKPETLRVAHLSDIAVPMLFVTGTRDAMAARELVERWLVPLTNATVVMIEDADHSFRVPRGAREVFGEIIGRSVLWLEGLD